MTDVRVLVPRCETSTVARKHRLVPGGRPTTTATMDPDWLSFGGWSDRFARVVADAVMGRFGVAVIDSNNDGRELSVLVVAKDRDGAWQWAQEHSDAAPSGTERTLGCVYAWGRSAPRTTVTIEYA